MLRTPRIPCVRTLTQNFKLTDHAHTTPSNRN
jgi:hypothetical protein